MADKRSDEEKGKDCLNILKVLKQIRQPYEGMIDDILTYIHHGRRTVSGKTGQKGNKTGRQVYDSTALGAVNLSSDGLAGYSFSRSFRWFEYTLPGKFNFPRWSGMRAWSGKRMDEYPDVKNWLESCEEVMYAAFLRSNFYDISPEKVKDAITIGTVNVDIEEDMDAGRIIFTLPHFRECYIAENAFGEVDTRYRQYKLTLRQLVKKFGAETMQNAMTDFEDRYNKNRHEELEVLHAIFPRDEYDPYKVDKLNKPYASMWFLLTGTKGRSNVNLLLESGYDERPFICWRWRKNNDEWYGRSPCWDAFAEVMRGNQAARTNLIAAQKMAEPPMIGPEDLRGLVQTGPKGWTFMQNYNKDKIPQMLNTVSALPFAIDEQERIDQKIREHLFVDFFLLLSQTAQENRNITATQVVEMMGEKAAVLGPRIGRMESEDANPIHDRMFAIEQRAGRIPEPPDILLEYTESGIEIDYMGPLSQAQKKLFKSQGINAGIEALGPLAEIQPQVIDVIDPDETARILLESVGFPSKATRDDAAIAKIRKIREQQQQVAQTIEAGSEIAKALPAAGKAPEPGSPLESLMAEGEA